ncbi:alpha carbonic anhydrase 1, chloroplastic-like [Wolffia australiana]
MRCLERVQSNPPSTNVNFEVRDDSGGRTRFSYDGNSDPQKWSDLSPEFFLCSNGTRQSPIDISRSAAVRDPKLRPLHSIYAKASATLVGKVKYGEGVGAIVVDGVKYKLDHVHRHSPYEHIIDDIRYPAELHLVHVSPSGDLSVVAVLYKYGRPDPFLSQLKEKVAALSKAVKTGIPNANVTAGLVRTRALISSTSKYYRYVKQISKEQVTSLIDLLEYDCRNNTRPTQPLHGRRVLLCHGGV